MINASGVFVEAEMPKRCLKAATSSFFDRLPVGGAVPRAVAAGEGFLGLFGEAFLVWDFFPVRALALVV